MDNERTLYGLKEGDVLHHDGKRFVVGYISPGDFPSVRVYPAESVCQAVSHCTRGKCGCAEWMTMEEASERAKAMKDAE